MSLPLQPYKGARDFYPEDKRIQNYMFSVMRQVVESYGYLEYDAPIIEPLELYQAKTGDEIVNEQTYQFKDRGGREVVIRPEMTPSVSRMVAARRQELPYPMRLYSIPNLWRYERPQRGRLREHWQLNVDIFGIDGIEADMEIIMVADAIMKAFGATADMYEIRINSRQLLEKRINASGIKTSLVKVIRVLDGYAKSDRTDVLKQLKEHVDNPDELLQSLENEGSSDAVNKIITQFKELGIDVIPSGTLARGFEYYTDIVFEIFDKHPDNNRSMFGGGRYDGLVGLFGVEPVATVGFGMGDVTLQNFLEAHKLMPIFKTNIDVAILTIGEVFKEATRLAAYLRESGLHVSIDPTDRKLDKKIKNADKHGVEKVIFFGQDELQENNFVLKNLHSGEEKRLEADELISILMV